MAKKLERRKVTLSPRRYVVSESALAVIASIRVLEGRPRSASLFRKMSLIAHEISEYHDSLEKMRATVTSLQHALTHDLKYMERRGRSKVAIQLVRDYVNGALNAFNDENVQAALEATEDHFSEAAITLEQLNRVITQRRRKKAEE